MFTNTAPMSPLRNIIHRPASVMAPLVVGWLTLLPGCEPAEDLEQRAFESDAAELNAADLNEVEFADAQLDSAQLDEIALTVFDGVDPKLALTPPPAAVDTDPVEQVELDLTISGSVTTSFTWLPWISEETPPSTCPTGHAATGLACDGAHCDNVALECGSQTANYGQRSWSPWFSEEGEGYHVCPGTQFVTGMACSGPWCDRISVECTDLGIYATSCQWSGYFTTNGPNFFAPPGSIVGGVECDAAYCEQKRYLVCQM